MNKPSRQGHAKNSLRWFVGASLSFWLAIAAAWWLSARIDYAYPMWYQVLAIDEHISRYAPHHPSKRDFARLTAEQHHQAFAAISHAVHGRGQPLESIAYQAPGRPVQTLLDNAEVRHLEDVARLLRLAGWATLAAFVLWLWTMAAQSGEALPSWRQRLLTVAVLAFAVSALLLLAGPKVVFYQLHVWLFPPENPWFFYWEESLMSTLMKAPFLFGGIAVQILLLALVLVLPIHLAGRRLGDLLGRR